MQKSQILNFNLLQWGIPLLLSIISILFELVEHGVEEGLELTVSVVSELILFGILVPVILFITIAWMRVLVEAERKGAKKVQELNLELEQKVADRTEALEKRNLELIRANKELKKLDEMKSEFVSMVSHELRAPLTTLTGGLELAMKHSGNIPPAARRTLQVMEGETARLTRKVQTILDISRLEAGKLEIILGPVALRPLMEQAAEVILTPKERPVKWEFSDSLPPVLADEVHLEEIIRNLMRNAVKYSPPDSTIHLCACCEGKNIKIAVKDHGAGVPAKLQSYIFKQFTRGVRENDDSAPQGWGLGLYFARKMAEAQHGTIDVNSPVWEEEGAPGSEFFLILPVAEFSEE